MSAEYLGREILSGLAEVDRPTGISGSDITFLPAIPVGKKSAAHYQDYIFRVLQSILDGQLRHGRKEQTQLSGRKRIDVVFDNCAADGFFFDLQARHGISAPFIIIECKNYAVDPDNPEFDQLSGRLRPGIGHFGMLFCRQIKDRARLTARCHDYVSKGEYIIALDDADTTNLLSLRLGGNLIGIDALLNHRLNEILFG